MKTFLFFLEHEIFFAISNEKWLHEYDEVSTFPFA